MTDTQHSMEEAQGTILLVEDDIALRTSLRNALDMHGFTVLEADSRPEAMECLNDSTETQNEETQNINSKISVMVLDLGLPPMEHTTDEGLATIKQVTEDFHLTKIIVLTGQDEEQSALDAIREGAFDFLSKPASFEDILNAVNRAFLFYRKEQDMTAEGMTRLQISAKVSDGLKAVREEAEEKLVRQVLKESGFNVYQSAARLGIKRESVYYFMKKFGISRDDT
jgi:DNA-binding NtrC family response regulator